MVKRSIFAFAAFALAALATAPPAIAAAPPGLFQGAQSDETTFDVSAVADVAPVNATAAHIDRASIGGDVPRLQLASLSCFGADCAGSIAVDAPAPIDPGRLRIA